MMSMMCIIMVSMLLLSPFVVGVSLTTSKDTIESVIIYGSTVSEVTRSFLLTSNDNNSNGGKNQGGIPSGIHAITVTGLPKSLDDRSVEIKGLDGLQNMEILDVKVSERLLPRDALTEYRTLMKQLNDLLRDVQFKLMKNERMNDSIEKRLLSVYSYVEHSLNASTSKSVSQVMELLTFQDQQMQELNTQRINYWKEKKGLERDLGLVTEAVQELSLQGVYTPLAVDGAPEDGKVTFETKTEKQVSFQVQLTIPTDKPLKILLSYFTSPAHWSAEYDVRVGKALQTRFSASMASKLSQLSATQQRSLNLGQYAVEIDYLASVEQHTGEDWVDVDLALSTSFPAMAPLLPVVVPRGLYFAGKGGWGMLSSMSRSSAESMAFLSGGPPIADQMMQAASTSVSGDLAAAYLFQINYHVNVTSSVDRATNFNAHNLNNNGIRASGVNVDASVSGVTAQTPSPTLPPRHRLLIDKVSLPGTLFTFAVPSASTTANLRLWGSLPSNVSTSLLASLSTRVFIEGAYIGYTNFDTVKAGGDVKLNLGENKNFCIRATAIVPQNKKLVEDRSTWFITDKEKFRVITEESLFSATNLYPTSAPDALLVLAENLPRSSESEITVELLVPSPQDITNTYDAAQQVLKDALTKVSSPPTAALGHEEPQSRFLTVTQNALDALSSDVAQEEDYLNAVLHASMLLRAAAIQNQISERTASKRTTHPLTDPYSLYVFKNKATGNIYWCKWTTSGEKFSSTFKYRYMWPERMPKVLVQ